MGFQEDVQRNVSDHTQKEHANSTGELPVSSSNYIKYVKTRSHRTRDKIIAALASPTNAGLSQEALARQIRISPRSLRAHLASDPSIKSTAREFFHKYYVPREMMEIDRVALQQAQSGDVQAMALCYKIYDRLGVRETTQQSKELEIITKNRTNPSGIRAESGVLVRLRRGD